LSKRLRHALSVRIHSIADKDLKEFDMDRLGKIFEKMEDIVRTFEEENLSDFFMFREHEELKLYERFLDSFAFDKKLKGINGFREYISYLEPKADEK
jgi:hypothetical protein